MVLDMGKAGIEDQFGLWCVHQYRPYYFPECRDIEIGAFGNVRQMLCK